ncbi:MAG: formate--tetrahydrofolate ligase, partial [Thermoplasmata archaeon]
NFKPIYDINLPIKEKIKIIATEIYGAKDVVYTPEAEETINILTKLGYDKLPINMAKTQRSITDDPKIKGAPRDWKLTVREVRISAGAGFIVPLTGQIMTMPGLPEVPAAEKIDITDEGYIIGLN